MNGIDLLAEFRESRSEKAFSELVRRYTNLVYSVAKRRLANVSLAQEVTQIVFIRLAKASPNIRGDAELVAWLHRTTVNVSIDLWRSESRRRAREEHVAAMQPDDRTENPAWTEIAPVLDEALNELEDTDRQVILLRFFEQKSMRELGSRFGISEDAAKMRVSRAMDKLRTRFAGMGAACTAAALGAVLMEHSVEAAPADLASTLAALRIPTGLGAGGGLAGLLAQAAKVKPVVGLVAAIVITGIAILVVHSLKGGGRNSATNAGQGVVSNQDSGAAGTVGDFAASNNAAGAAQNEPDPRKLLQGVARARQRIISGKLEFQVATYYFDREYEGTNSMRLKALFDGSNRRFEAFKREYSYVALEPEGIAVADARMRTERLSREAAVRAGLFKGFESHHVTIYDGAAVLDYSEKDGRPDGTVITDTATGSEYLFDPRCFGLIGFWVGGSVENCFRCDSAATVQLVGKEEEEGVTVWHVRVQSGEPFDVWIDAAHPLRVVKYAQGLDVVWSKYDEADVNSTLPVEVSVTSFRNGIPCDERRFTCSNAKFNFPIAPASWTLAGLGMAVGTSVADIRIHRRIGYWTGSGLSEHLPSKTGEPQSPPDRSELMALLDIDPASFTALEAAQWILLNTPDSPEVEKAADVILRDHILSTNMLGLSQELERMRHGCSRRLLEAMMDKNPMGEVKGNACFTLATLQKDAAKYGQDKQATAEAAKLFERVISNFGQVRRNGNLLADLAKPELWDLHNLIIGKPAPKTEGEDLEGRPLKLSNYRGKVVALVFWGHCGGCRPEVRTLREAQQHLAKKPFAIVGVYTDNHSDEAKAIAEKFEMTWPSFKEELLGPIATAWNMHGWPNIWVLDAKGVIRHRDVREGQLAQVVEELLGEKR
jgi:RNA polymerase sigma factor (sigma-70 family)